MCTAWCDSDANHGLQSLFITTCFLFKGVRGTKGGERRGGMKFRFSAVDELQMLLVGQKVLPPIALQRCCCMFFLEGDRIKEEELG